MRKRHYSSEFKLEAVRLSYKRDNIKELANELGSLDSFVLWQSPY